MHIVERFTGHVRMGIFQSEKKRKRQIFSGAHVFKLRSADTQWRAPWYPFKTHFIYQYEKKAVFEYRRGTRQA